MMIESLAISGLKLIVPSKVEDHRGFLCEVYRRDVCAAAGIAVDFVQINHSRSARPGTIRGLHFQQHPFAQAKLVRVIRGRVYDVAVDLRATSSAYGAHVGVELSADNFRQLLVPIGFAHGFCTLEPDTEVEYMLTNYYAPEHDRGLMWNDPDLKIDWPLEGRSPSISVRDQNYPRLSDLARFFD